MRSVSFLLAAFYVGFQGFGFRVCRFSPTKSGFRLLAGFAANDVTSRRKSGVPSTGCLIRGLYTVVLGV